MALSISGHVGFDYPVFALEQCLMWINLKDFKASVIVQGEQNAEANKTDSKLGDFGQIHSPGYNASHFLCS